MNIFWPLITHSSPSRTARVWAAATSEPASGSLKPRTMMISPRERPGQDLALQLVGADGLAMTRATIIVVPCA